MKPTPEDKPEGAPNWILPYADMVTIMLAFFVIMFSYTARESRKQQAAAKQAAEQSAQARGETNWNPAMLWGWIAKKTAAPSGEKEIPAPAVAVAAPNADRAVKPRAPKPPTIRVPLGSEPSAIGGTVEFDESALQLPPRQQARLQQIAEELAGKPQQVEIVATVTRHPLSPGSSFRDRWDLAYARCRQLAELLASLNIEPDRLRLTVLPAESPSVDRNLTPSEADSSVRIYLSSTIPPQVR